MTGDGGSVPTDGNAQDGENLSPTDIEANLSTEVALTVLDVLELFVHHHKVCCPRCVDFQFDALRGSIVFRWEGQWTLFEQEAVMLK